MEEDKRLQAAGALVAIAALVLVTIQFAANRPATKVSAGPGWSSRINPFGSAPSEEPAPASGSAPADLAPPERVMTNAASRQFSSPTSGGASGRLAGAEPVSAPAEVANAPMSAARLGGGGFASLPDGGRAPIFGGAAARPAAPGGGTRPAAPAHPGGTRPGPAVGAAGGAPRGGGGGASPGGDTRGAASAAAAFNSAAGASASAGATPGSRLGAMGAGGVPPAKAPGLNETPSLPGGSPGGGGPGDLGGGGGGGAGGSGGMGGAVPGGKPTQSAGRPAGADAGGGGAGAAAAAGGSAGGSSGGGSGGGGEEERPLTAMSGTPDVADAGTPSGKKFALKPGGPAVIDTLILRTKKNVPIVGFTAKMAIDDDGKGGGGMGDPTRRKETSLKYPGGESLNPRVVPFVVIPLDFPKAHPDVKLGDYSAVTYGGKTLYAIVGDMGPRGVLGEGSTALASGMGINANPVSGGLDGAVVRYLIIPGSGSKFPIPRRPAEVQRQGRLAFEAAGAELK